ncbi:multiple ankyrin repeats single kh domain protein [Rutstroemia sp. NJR-2017a BVV2]|nr:multiple ankyrin repeats single kh domain protein [Rutstroemia sp. NJR-2017a BVV2]
MALLDGRPVPTVPHPPTSKQFSALLSPASRMRPQWEPHKEKIRELYLDQGLALAEVMSVMRHEGLTASKRSYERQLKRWKFEKNWKYDALRIVKARYTSLLQQRVIFDVRFNGNCLDELVWKKFDDYRVPLSDKYRLNASGFIDMPLQMRALVIPALRREASALLGEHHSNLIRDIFHNLCAVMPITEEDEICSLIGQIIGWDSSSATTQFLKLAIYFLSNKLFDKDTDIYWNINDELLRWFKIGNHHRLLRGILSSRTPTIDALAEGLFASAVKAEDLAFSRIFLESGLNPDIEIGHCEKHGDKHSIEIYHSYGTPLNLAIQRSNIGLIQLLFEFHANADRASGYALVWAIEAGNVEITRILISEGAFVNAVPVSGPTALQAALKRGNVEIVRLLLDTRADVNLSGNGEYRYIGSPLSCAIISGVQTLVDMLLDRGAKLDPRDARYIGTSLQLAIRSKNEMEIGRLLQLKTDVNVPASERDGRTALQGAAENGDLELCHVLIQAGADVNAAPAPRFPYERLTKGVTALVAAVNSRNHQVVELLVESGADINAIIFAGNPDTGCTALASATHLDDVEMVQYLVHSGADPRHDDSILYAVGERRTELVKILLGAGADINCHTKRGNHDLLYKAVGVEDLDFIRLLLNYGARPRPQCLQKAAEQGNLPIIQLLINAGANINTYQPTILSKNALQAAASMGNMDMVKYLLDQDADVNWPAGDTYGLTALQAAVTSGCVELVQFLITRGADVNAPAANEGGITALQGAVRRNNKPLVDLLLEAGANANDEPANEGGLSSLQQAARNGEDDLIETLLSHKASINGPVALKDGRTALQAAAKNGHFTTVRLLLEKGAHVNAPGSPSAISGTALQLAAQEGYVRIAKALIDAGANIDARRVKEDGYGGTALEFAAKYGRIDMLKLLLNSGADITTGAGRRQLRNALREATKHGHDAAAKFLECHQISKEDMGVADDPVEAGVFQIMEE